jgi:acetyl-CoA C-acetyltransferase
MPSRSSGPAPATTIDTTSMDKDAMNPVICSIARTPIGRFNDVFSPLAATDLGGVAIAGALERAGLAPEQVDEVIFGHVIQAGQGQITARQAAVNAGIPMSVPAMTINKVCLSGMTAIQEAANHVKLGESKFVVAGGMESMTNAPYIVPGARGGLRLGDGTIVDSLTHDGLFCAFDSCMMGESSDIRNTELGIARTDQDDWSAISHAKALAATESGVFAEEIVPVEVPQRKGDPLIVSEDGGIRPETTTESLGSLRPAFAAEGTITAGNASQISDGAAAVVVADRAAAEALELPILAEIVSYGQIAGPDATLHERPSQALQLALKRAELDVNDIDLFEINEAFASVAMWSTHLLGIDHDKVNVHGGAVALGHPLGATGARIVVTLINALRSTGGTLGAAALCGGGGQGDALIVEMV